MTTEDVNMIYELCDKLNDICINMYSGMCEDCIITGFEREYDIAYNANCKTIYIIMCLLGVNKGSAQYYKEQYRLWNSNIDSNNCSICNNKDLSNKMLCFTCFVANNLCKEI